MALLNVFILPSIGIFKRRLVIYFLFCFFWLCCYIFYVLFSGLSDIGRMALHNMFKNGYLPKKACHVSCELVWACDLTITCWNSTPTIMPFLTFYLCYETAFCLVHCDFVTKTIQQISTFIEKFVVQGPGHHGNFVVVWEACYMQRLLQGKLETTKDYQCKFERIITALRS